MSPETVYSVLRLGFLNGYVVPVKNDPYDKFRVSLRKPYRKERQS